jgi:hypothetical protein
LRQRAAAARYTKHHSTPTSRTAIESIAIGRSGGIKMGIAADAINPTLIRTTLNKLSHRSKNVFFTRKKITL